VALPHAGEQPNLVEESDPVLPGDPANKLAFRDMYKEGLAKTDKEMMDDGRTQLQSGDIPIGSSISPVFYVRNKGGALQGARLTITGTSLDQGIISEPQILMTAYDTRNEVVTAPKTENKNGIVTWTVDAPHFDLNSEAQMRVAMNCKVSKAGSGAVIFTISPISDPSKVLIRHADTIFIKQGH